MSLSAAAVGAAAVVGQTVLVRELMVSFYGTEPALACALGGWLLFVALGALSAASLLRAVRRPLRPARLAMLAVPLGLYAGFVLARCVRPLLGAGSGAFLSVDAMLVGGAAASLPAAFPVGFFFTCACRVEEGAVPRAGRGIGRVYVWEALGSAAAGGLLSFVLLGRVGPAALLTGAAACVFAAGTFDALLRRERGAALSWIALGTVLCALAVGGGHLVEWHTAQARWRSYSAFELVSRRDSRYQDVELGVRQGEYLLLCNGRKSAQWPDEAAARARAALLLTQHPDPRNVLMIGSGLDGPCQEMLRTSVCSLKLLESDAVVVDLLLSHLAVELRAPLEDPRFRLHLRDARAFLRDGAAGDGLYDLIVVAVGDPTSAAAARYYTVEFFRMLRHALRPGGAVAVCDVTGAENYGRSRPVLDYTGCVYRTLRDVFEHVVVRPGDRFCFFAAGAPGVVTADAEALEGRFDRLGLEPKVLGRALGTLEFPPERTVETLALLEAARPDALLNTDDRPVVFTLFLALQRQYAAGGPRGPEVGADVHTRVRAAGPAWPLRALALGLVAAAALRVLLGRRAAAPAGCALVVLTTGVLGLSAEMLVVYGYQVAFGHVYRDVALIVGLFMGGLAAGGQLAVRLARGRPVGTLALLEVLQAALIATIPAAMGAGVLPPWAFMALAAAAGVLTGAVFPLAARVALAEARDAGTVAGVFDAADHLGGMAGAICVGLLLVPALGLSWTAAMLVGLKVASLGVLAVTAFGGSGARRGGVGAG